VSLAVNRTSEHDASSTENITRMLVDVIEPRQYQPVSFKFSTQVYVIAARVTVTNGDVA